MDETNVTQDFSKAKAIVYRLLKIRVRSEKEVIDRLKKKEISSEIIARTVDYFKNSGFINDTDFARAFTASRLNRPLGISRVRFELRQKGIAEEIIEATLAQAGGQFDEYEAVLVLAQKRKRKYTGLDKIKAQNRLFGYLQRRGFHTSTITKVVKELWKKQNDNE